MAVPQGRPGAAQPERWTSATVYPDMWLDPADDPREPEAATGTDERSTSVEYLRRYRLTLQLKCADLDAEQLARRSVPPSTMSLLGLVRHLTDVERVWFRRRLADTEAPPLYWDGPEGDIDWSGATADPEVVTQSWERWHAEVRFAERFVDAHSDLDFISGTGTGLRDVLVHMVEEYARHCGHADLLRECIDGRVGQ